LIPLPDFPIVLGITGGYCAGKDVVCSLLSSRGFYEIDEDHIGHLALEYKIEEITSAFGDSVLSVDGAVDRRALGKKVFNNPTDLESLEGIVHPWMVEETRKQIVSSDGELLLINAAILFHMGLHVLCDAVVEVTAPTLVRAFRGLRRDKIGLWQVLKRIQSQMSDKNPQHFLNERGASVDIVRVSNGGNKRALSRQVERVLSNYGITGRLR
jgi:dephospho-CoA kinase